MSETKLTRAELAQFTGSEEWHRHGLVRSILFTDGAKYVADKPAPTGFSTKSRWRSVSGRPWRRRNSSFGG